MNYYINCQGGLGLNLGLASFISYIKMNGDDNGKKDYEFNVCSAYYDVFEACQYVSTVYKPNELKDLILDAVADPDSLIINFRIYDMDGFIKKDLNYSQAWASLMGIPFTDNDNGTKATSVLNVFNKYPSLKNMYDSIVKQIRDDGYKYWTIMQFTGGQSPLVQVPPKEGTNEPDWSKVPYNYDNEPLKRHYPIDKAEKFVKLYKEKHPDTAVILYQLPNEPHPVVEKGTYLWTVPYLVYYELAKDAREIVTIDSSLQHLTAGLCKTTVIWGHSKPSNFGYSYNHNIEQPCRTSDLVYFSALGPSGAKVTYISPESLLEETENAQ